MPQTHSWSLTHHIRKVHKMFTMSEEYAMGIEHCHKSRKLPPPPPRAFPSNLRAISYPASLPPGAILLPARRKTAWVCAESTRNTFPCSRASDFYLVSVFFSVRGRAWGHANHHCIPEYNWLSECLNDMYRDLVSWLECLQNVTQSNELQYVCLSAVFSVLFSF